jgi:hypothetical protein
MPKTSKKPPAIAVTADDSFCEREPIFLNGKIREDASPLDLVFAMFTLDLDERFLEVILRTTAADVDFMADSLNMSDSAAVDVADALHRLSMRLTVCLEFERRRRFTLEQDQDQAPPESSPRSRQGRSA